MLRKYLFIIFTITTIYGLDKIYTDQFDTFRIENIDSYTVEINISIGELMFHPIEINEKEYVELSLNNSYPSKNIGSPNLPMLNQIIEIPRGGSIRLEIIEDDIEIYNIKNYNINNLLAPVQPSIPKSGPISNFIINEQHYNSNLFKNELIEIDEKGLMREVRIANLMISPIEYNPIENKIILHKNLKFKLHFENANIDLTNTKKRKGYSPYFEPIFHKAIANYTPPANIRDDFIGDIVNYIIITDQSFSNSLQPFIDWKTQKGFHVDVAYTNQIGSSANAIKNYLQNEYNNPSIAIPTFVLLVGDTPQIPASYSSGGHVSDLDYCDYTNDNLPDVLCGRFSAQSAIHVSAQVNKTIEYEQYTMPDPSFLGEVLMISGVDASFAPTYGNGQINYGNNYYFNSDIGINSNTFLYPASGNSANQILNLAKQGMSLINYTAHGWEDGWADPEFDINDANNMSNTSQYPTMIGNCCLTNAFDSGTCFGEALLRKANGGAIGYIGGSDVTYWDEDFWWGVGSGNISSNPSYNNTGEGVYDCMFHLQNEENWAIVNSAMIIAGNLAVAQGNGMDDYYWEIYHLMGDPSLSTYQGIPTVNNVNHDIFIPIGTEAIEIQANPHSYVGLSQNGNLISSGTVDESGFVVLVFNALDNAGTLDITVTAQNKIPYFAEIFVASPDGAYTTINSVELDYGNDNLISIGETINLEIEVENIGSETASNIELSLSAIDSPYIELITSNTTISNLSINQTAIANLAFRISQNAPYGHQFSINLIMTSEENAWESNYSLTVESLIESFDSETFNDFAWESSGNAIWTIQNGQFIGESTSARSGSISENMMSDLAITMEIVENGQIKFDKKVSCEDVGSQTGNYYDYLAFYIDGIEQAKWAGEMNWSQHSFNVSSGEHTFLWRYTKDGGVTSGDDAAWIDNIIFPPSFYSAMMLGDINLDGAINIQDVILTVNIILSSLEYNQSADVNEDDVIDVLDIINIVSLILQ